MTPRSFDPSVRRPIVDGQRVMNDRTGAAPRGPLEIVRLGDPLLEDSGLRNGHPPPSAAANNRDGMSNLDADGRGAIGKK